MILRRRILACSTLVAGILGIAPAIYAQIFDANFQANIPQICQETVNIGGTLGFNPTIVPIQVIGSELPRGAAAQIEVDCNSDAQIILDNVTVLSAPNEDPGGTNYDVSVQNAIGINAQGDGVAPGPIGPGQSVALNTTQIGGVAPGVNELDVDLTVDRGSGGGDFIAGSYEYQVQFTITP